MATDDLGKQGDSSGLTALQHHVTREKGTEHPFSGKYHDCKTAGMYRCVCCGSELFSSANKFDSGTGWPSYSRPIKSSAVALNDDNSLGASRTEVVCKSCDAHLGHVFPDGPPAAGGQRYCINSASLRLDPDKPGQQ